MTSYAVALLAGTMVLSQAPDLPTLQKDALGKWERQLDYEGTPHRLVKEVGERQETLSLYTQDGALVYQHVVDYRIRVDGDLAIFEYWNLRVLAGGQEEEETAARDANSAQKKASYAFKILDNKWYEAQGFQIDNDRIPRMNIFSRVTESSPAAAATAEARLPPGKEHLQELAFLIGTWQNADNPKDQRSFEWINNKSYIMFLAGDYREIIGWDLVHERIVSWGYGTDGGQGKGLWTKEGDQWKCVSRGFLDRWGGSLQPFGSTIEQIDENTLRISSLNKDSTGKPASVTTLKRVTTEENGEQIANGKDK